MKNEKFAKLKNLLGKGDGWKKKLSIFLALSLILSGVKGISLLGIGRENDAPEGNTVEIRGDRIKLHLEGETVRELAEKAVREGKLLCAENGELSYSRNEELLARYRELFSEEREVYELPLDQVVEGLDELSAVGGKVRAFVEVDPKKQRGNTEKDSMDAVALFSRDSAFGRLLLAVKGESYFKSVKGRDASSVSGEEATPGGEGGPGQEVKEKKESAGVTGPGQGLQVEIETEQTEVVRPAKGNGTAWSQTGNPSGRAGNERGKCCRAGSTARRRNGKSSARKRRKSSSWRGDRRAGIGSRCFQGKRRDRGSRSCSGHEICRRRLKRGRKPRAFYLWYGYGSIFRRGYFAWYGSRFSCIRKKLYRRRKCRRGGKFRRSGTYGKQSGNSGNDCRDC